MRKRISDAIDIKPGDPSKMFEMRKKLGQGAGGVVWECRDRRNGEIVAVKRSQLEDLDEIKNEIAIQNLSKHDNVLKFLETYTYQDEIWIVVELMDGGALTTIVGRGVHWNEEYIAYVLKQCLQGLESLHANHRLHTQIPNRIGLVG